MNRRKHMPLGVKLEAAIRQLGLDPKDVQYDHHPALGLRERNEQGVYTPDENDPRYIVLRSAADHKVKTGGRRGEKMASAADGDTHKIAKSKRLARATDEFRRRMLAKEPGRKAGRQPRWRWPARKLRQRPRAG